MKKPQNIYKFLQKYGEEKQCQNYFKKLKKKRRETIFDNKISLKKWFLAIYLMTVMVDGVYKKDLVNIVGLSRLQAKIVLKNIRYAINTKEFKETII